MKFFSLRISNNNESYLQKSEFSYEIITRRVDATRCPGSKGVQRICLTSRVSADTQKHIRSHWQLTIGHAVASQRIETIPRARA